MYLCFILFRMQNLLSKIDKFGINISFHYIIDVYNLNIKLLTWSIFF